MASSRSLVFLLVFIPLTAAAQTEALIVDTPPSGAHFGNGGIVFAGGARDTLAVHLWAWPLDGTEPTFLGASLIDQIHAVLGIAAGWRVNAPALAAGRYVVVAYGWSARTFSFSNEAHVVIDVGGTSDERIPACLSQVSVATSRGPAVVTVFVCGAF